MAQARSVTNALSVEERNTLAKLAQSCVEQGFESGEKSTAETLEKPVFQALLEPCGAFVTLNIKGRLRGCIGAIVTQQPLYVTIAQMAYAAAFEDPRFPALERDEWPGTSMEISILSVPERCPDANLVEVGRHGLVLVFGGKSGVFLPQVPVEQGWQLEEYLEALCIKASVPPGSWKNRQAELYWFEASVFAARHATDRG